MRHANFIELLLAIFYVPFPDKVMFCGAPPPLSWADTFAVNAPLSLGVKVTLIVQLAPAARLVPQLLVWEKLVVRAPEIKMLVMVTVAVLTFDMATPTGLLEVLRV